MFSAAPRRPKTPTFGGNIYRWLRHALHAPCMVCGKFCRGQELCDRCLADLQQTPWGIGGLTIAQTRIPVIWRESYGGPLSGTVVRAKYFGDWGAARLLGQELGRLPRPWLGTPPLVVPIPLADSRLAGRGFNQSQWIATAVAKAWGVPMRPRWLRKTKASARQASLARQERLHNLSGVFCASEAVRGQRIVLIDDIMTSGTTLREAAGAITAGGGQVIAAAVIAHVRQSRGHLQSNPTRKHHVQRRLI